jgi:hypothetical protein
MYNPTLGTQPFKSHISGSDWSTLQFKCPLLHLFTLSPPNIWYTIFTSPITAACSRNLTFHQFAVSLTLNWANSMKEYLLWSVSHSPLLSDLLGPDDIQWLSHTGICIIQTCVTGQMGGGDWNITNLQQFYETTTRIPITKYEDTLLLSKWDVLIDTLDRDWLRTLSLCIYSSSGSESDVRGGTSS